MAKRQLKMRKMTVTNRRRAQSVVQQPDAENISEHALSPNSTLAKVIEINAHQRT